MVFTSQPGGAVADIAMPVVYPNLAGADPGTRMELYAFNHDTVQWYIYGYGRVSADGLSIVPEIDPSTGRSYGLRDFSWHFVGSNWRTEVVCNISARGGEYGAESVDQQVIQRFAPPVSDMLRIFPRRRQYKQRTANDAAAEARLNGLQRNGLDSGGTPTVKPGRP